MEIGVENQKRALKLFSSYSNRKSLSNQVSMIEEFSESTVDSFIILLQCEAKHLKVDFVEHASQCVIEAVACLQDDSKSRPFLLNVITKLKKLNALSSIEIQKKFNELPSVIPLDILSHCDKLGVVSTIHYFQSCVDNSKKAATLLKFLHEAICEQGNNQQVQFKCFVDMFIEIGHGTLPPEMQARVSSKTINACVVMLKNLTRKIWDSMWENPDCQVTVFHLSECNQSGFPKLSSYQACYVELLAYLLTYKPEIKSATAISSQLEWIYLKNPKNILSFITQLLVPLEIQMVVDKIDDILSRYEVNWKTLLIAVSVIHTCYPTGTKQLKGLISSLLQRAMDKSREDLLLSSFLLARQITHENSFASYGFWFSTICTPSTNPKHVVFVLKYLISIAQHEIAPVLRAHLANQPYLPSVDYHRNLWADYTALIRTRLVDLGPSGQQTLLDAPVDESIEKDVQQAVADYVRIQRLPNSVMQAAIFKKSYFLHKFLPVLLKPRRTPHPPDAQQNFIEDLKKSGKLPAPMYMEYISACQSIDYKFMDGIPLNETEMDWQSAADPMTEFRNQMRQLSESWTSDSNPIERIPKILRELIRTSETKLEFVDISPDEIRDQLAKDQPALKVLEIWFETLKKAMGKTEQSPEWIAPVFIHFCSNTRVIRSLYFYMWIAVADANCTDPLMMRCYGCIFYLLQRNSHLLIPARFMETKADYIQILMDRNFNLKEAGPMRFLHSLLRTVLMEGRHGAESALPWLLRIGQLHAWLDRRIQFSTSRFRSESVGGTHSCNEFVFQSVSKLSLAEWIRLEIEVDPDRDVLLWNQRCQYLLCIFREDYSHDSRVPELLLDAIVHCSLDPPSDQKNCSQSLLMLLQSILLQDQPSESSSAWLPRYWISLHSSNRIRNVDLCLWSLVSALPAYLLCKNAIFQSPTEDSLRTLTSLVQDYWRNSISEGAWLPEHVVKHLTGALCGISGSEQQFPCLEFSKAIHGEASASPPWDSLQKALSVFHPAKSTRLQWSGVDNVDTLASQLTVIASAVWFMENPSRDWPWYVREVGEKVAKNPQLLRGWKITAWMDGFLPWTKMLPTHIMDLLPYVIAQVLLTWKEIFPTNSPLWPSYLECLILAHSRWVDISRSCIDRATTSPIDPSPIYPAGQLLDLATLGRLSNRIQQILNQSPIHVIRALHQSAIYPEMDAGLRAAVESRLKCK